LPFPEVRHCIVCENVRSETHNKLTILGFSGVAPDVAIHVLDLNKPLELLTFILVCGPSDGIEAAFSAMIRSQNGLTVGSQVGPSKLSVPKTVAFQLVLSISSPQFPAPGRYALVVQVDGTSAFEAEFQVERATASDFKG
jgi:hypothetical protein